MRALKEYPEIEFVDEREANLFRFGDDVVFVLFLCGYFDAAYLGYEAAEGIDWVWEHRTEDLDKLGI